MLNIGNMEDTIPGIWQGKCLIDIQLSSHQNPPLHSDLFQETSLLPLHTAFPPFLAFFGADLRFVSLRNV